MNKVNITAIIILLILAAAVSVYFYDSYKKTQANVLIVETSLSDEGFFDFYKKDGNKLCAQAGDETEQENIAKDMLWSLELDNVEVRKLEIVECADGGSGVLVK